jgi:ribose/xylose/arabinose/galactoside ABC-type transport system permease subunit
MSKFLVKLKKQLLTKTFGLIVITALLVLGVYFINEGFLKPISIRNFLNILAFEGPLLAGVAILLMAGGFDFSNGAVAALCSLIFAVLLKAVPGLPWPVVFLIAVACGAAIELVNVFFINVLNLMPFIITMATSLILGGIGTVWSGSTSVPVSLKAFTDLGNFAFFNVIPLIFVISALIVIGHAIVLQKTRFGRNIYMVGGNPLAARLCGLSIKRTRAILYISNGIWCAIAGLMWVALRKQSNPAGYTLASYHMTVMIAALIGGVSFMGGAGGMGGATIGLVMYNVLQIGLSYLKAPSYMVTIVMGVLLIVALLLDNYTAMRMRRALMVAAIKQTAALKKEKATTSP